VLRALAALLFIPLSLEGVTVGWDAPPGATGYYVYVGSASRIYNQLYSSRINSAFINNAAPGQRMYIAVTALNSFGESSYSDELVFTVPAVTNTVLTVDHSDDPFGPWTNKVSLTNLMGWKGFYRVNLVVNTNQ